MEERRDHKTRFQSQGEGIPAGTKPISAAFPPDIDTILRKIPNRSVKIRQWVRQGIELEERAFLMVELASKDDREAFKLWCQVNGHEMTSYVRALIEEPIREGRAMMEQLRVGKDK